MIKNPEQIGYVSHGGGLYRFEYDYEMRLEVEGGIYIGSTVADSCRVWDCIIKNNPAVVGPLGDCEHFRTHLDKCKSSTLGKGEIMWITDRTPHESLPNQSTDPVYRQFFQLVTSLGVWYSQHNTPNPLGILPDALVSDANKFELLQSPHPPEEQ
jgi:hypothetical protein